MLTRTGWKALFGGGALVVAGRLLGAFELYLLGAGVGALLGIAALNVSLNRVRLGLTRTVVPPRVDAGGEARGEVELLNHAGRTMRGVRLHDAVAGTRGATLLVGPLAAGAHASAAYQLPTDRRGAVRIGPMELVIADPFGLCERRTEVAGPAQLVVYPHLDDLLALEHGSAHDPQATTRNPNALGRVGDDFYALRPYVVGDDLRRVHWASVARTGEMMVRQHELPWQERTTVLLDARAVAHSPATFERAVSAAASILVAAVARGDQVRLCTTDRSDSGFGGGRTHVDALLHHLALQHTDTNTGLQPAVDDLLRAGPAGSLAVVTAGGPTAELSVLGALRRRFGTVVAVVFDDPAVPVRSPVAPGAGPAVGAAAGAVPQGWSGLPRHVIRCGPDDGFAERWNRSGVAGATAAALVGGSAS